MSSKTPISTPEPIPAPVREQRSEPIAAPHPKSPGAITPVSRSIPSDPPRQSGGWGWLIVLVLLAGGGWAGWHYRAAWLPLLEPLLPAKKDQKPQVRPPVPVVTATVQQRVMDVYLNGLGTVTALQTVTIRSRVDGEMVKVAFTEGQMVKKDDLLAEIDPRQFEVQRDQAAGQLERDEASLKVAQATLARFEKLVASNSVTPQEIDNQTALVEQAKGIIRTDKALVANAELQLTYCKIRAPFDGRIGLRLVDPGNIVKANDLTGIAVITQTQPIAVVFTIPQDDIYRVQQRMKGDTALRVDAYDRDFKTRLATGELLATDNQVDPATGTLRLKAIFNSDESALFPNQFVNTRLLVDTKQDAIVVPTAALQRGPDSTYVYVAKSDQTVEQRTVLVGPSEGIETAIESGLKAGEIVVTEGTDKLQDRTKIAPRDRDKLGKKPAGETANTAAKKDAR